MISGQEAVCKVKLTHLAGSSGGCILALTLSHAVVGTWQAGGQGRCILVLTNLSYAVVGTWQGGGGDKAGGTRASPACMQPLEFKLVWGSYWAPASPIASERSRTHPSTNKLLEGGGIRGGDARTCLRVHIAAPTRPMSDVNG